MDDCDDGTHVTPNPTKPHVVRPVTIRQLAQAQIREELTRTGPTSRYNLGGHDFYVATFVGHIVAIEASGETTRTIRMEDGTGKITSTLREDPEAEHPPVLREHAYARVFGVPRKFNETTMFEISSIRLVEDPHELLFHMMEAIVVTLHCSRGRPLPRLYDSQFANAVCPTLPLPTADPDISISMQSMALNSPPLRSHPLPDTSTPQVDDDPPDPSSAVGGTESDETHDTSGGDDGSTEYYTDQLQDSPNERSPSPAPAHPFVMNHSYEGHSDHGEDPSSQSSQSTVKPTARPNGEGGENGRTPEGESVQRSMVDAVPESPQKGPDEELEDLRSEFSSQPEPFTPPRKLKPDPYTGWSPAKRNIMVFIRSKTPGEEVNVKRALAEGTPKLEMRNAIRELVKEGEIETIDGINYRLTDKGPKYPRF